MYYLIDVKKTGQNLKRLFQINGFTVSQIQKELHIGSPQAIYRWLKGETLPSADNLLTLAVLLHVPIDALLVARENAADEEHIADIVLWAGTQAMQSETIRKAYYEVLGILILQK